jgi:hypothetical protein
MREEWRPVPGLPYEASNMGRVRSLRRMKPLKPKINTQGYESVGLFDAEAGKIRHRRVNRVVAAAWLGDLPAGMLVNHINGIKNDNRLENLEIITPSENVRHAYATGLARPVRGERHGIAKLTAEAVRAIRADGRHQKDIAAHYGVTQSAISLVKRGKNWGHVQ